MQIHGDAAFTGQGIVAETLQLSQLPHFSVPLPSLTNEDEADMCL